MPMFHRLRHEFLIIVFLNSVFINKIDVVFQKYLPRLSIEPRCATLSLLKD